MDTPTQMLDAHMRRLQDWQLAQIEAEIARLADEPNPPPFLGFLICPTEMEVEGYVVTVLNRTTDIRADNRADFDAICSAVARTSSMLIESQTRVLVLREDGRWQTPDGRHPRGYLADLPH
jgi:hypothetical protein